MSSLSEVDLLRSQVAELARELVERDQVLRGQCHHLDGELRDLRDRSTQLRAIITGTAEEIGDDFFPALVTHLTSVLNVQYAVIGEVRQDSARKQIHTIAVAAGGALVDNFEYDLLDTPCERALASSFVCFERGVQASFPSFTRLRQLNVEGYCGVSIRSKGGAVIGLLVLMDIKPLGDGDWLRSLLTMFASRAAAELERTRAEQERGQALTDLHNVMEAIPDILMTLDLLGHLVRWNKALERVTGYSAKELLNKHALEFVPPAEHEPAASAIQRAFRDGFAELEGHLLTKDGRTIPYHWTGATLKNHHGQVIGLTSMGRDITEREKTEQLLEVENQVLELMAPARPLTETLSFLCECCESLGHGMLASVLLLDQNGQHLRHCAAPSLPESYTRAIDEAAIGHRVGSCGTAAYLGRQVVVADIATDPLWEGFRELALSHGLRACWSNPIISDEGQVLGTFVLYSRSPHEPVPADLQLIHRMTNLAYLAIKRKRADELIREMNLVMAQAMPGISRIRSDGRYKEVNRSYAAMLGYEPDELIGQSWEPTVHPGDLHLAHAAYGQMIREGKGEFECRAVRKDGSIFFKHVMMLKSEGTEGELFGHLCLMRDISTRKQMEAELAEQEERLRLFIEHSPVALAMFDQEMRYLAVSRRWRSVFGLDDGPLIGRSHYEVFPEIPERWKAIHRRCLAGAVESCEEDPFVRADGRTDWARWEIHPWLTADGSVGGIVLFAEDITIQVQAREMQRRLVAIVESSDDAIISKDIEGRVTSWNRGAERLFGYQAEEMIGQPITRLFPPDRLKAELQILEQIKRGESIEHFETVRHTKDGRSLDVSLTLSPMRDEHGTIVGVSKIARDITERKRAEEALRLEGERLRFVTLATRDAIYDWDFHAKTVQRNDSYQAMFSPGEPTGTGSEWWEARLHPDDRQRIMEGLSRVFNEHIPFWSDEYRFMKSDGTYASVVDRGYILYCEDGQPSRMIGAIADITERKRAEGQLLELNARLATISSHLELVREEEQKRLAHDLHDELGHLLTAGKLDVSFLEQLMRSRSKSDRLALAETIGRLRRTLDGAIASVRKIARQARPGSLDQLGLVATLEALVSDVRDHAGIQARFTSVVDEERLVLGKTLEVALYRVAQEALTNVVRHSGATLVHVRLREEDGQILLEIQDNGKGFDESRYDPDQSFGLRGMKERLEMVGGRFSIVGCQGRGTVVTVTVSVPVGMPCQIS